MAKAKLCYFVSIFEEKKDYIWCIDGNLSWDTLPSFRCNFWQSWARPVPATIGLSNICLKWCIWIPYSGLYNKIVVGKQVKLISPPIRDIEKQSIMKWYKSIDLKTKFLPHVNTKNITLTTLVCLFIISNAETSQNTNADLYIWTLQTQMQISVQMQISAFEQVKIEKLAVTRQNYL